MRKTILQATAALVLLVALYLSLGLAAYLVPDKSMRGHVGRTLYIGDLLHNDYPKAILLEDYNVQDQYTLDNFTDALIVNQALSLRSEGLKGILLLPRYQWTDNTMCENVGHLIANDEGGECVHYGRYWHGSTFVTRLLFTLMTFIEIRYLLYILTSLMMLWCTIRLWRTADGATALAIIIGLMTVNVYVMQFSVQFAWVLILALATILWMTYHRDMKPAQCGLLLFVTGSLTAYFDLITVPTLTLGLPLVAWVALQQQGDWLRGIGNLLLLALWWLAGYVLTWLAKWGLATLLTDSNIFADAYVEATSWNNNSSSYIGAAFGNCLSKVQWFYVAVPALLLTVLAVVRPQKGGWRMALQYLLVMLIPLVYYLLMAHPAAHHSWFNYRALATAVAALLAALAALVDWQALSHKRKD